MRRLIRHLAGFAAGTAGALLLVEIVLRLLGHHPSPLMPDRAVGSRWWPGAHYRWNVEGFSEGRINAAGWRDRDYALAKPEGTTRILFLGDSYVQAMEVPLDSAFHKVLERELQARAAPGRRFEVPALGRGGFGTTDAYVTYRTWGRQYDPDVVALLFILNDWGDNWRWEGSGWNRPYLVPEGDSLRLDTSFVNSPHFRRMERLAVVKRYSSLANLVANAYQNMRARYRPTEMERGRVMEHGWHTAWNFDRSPAADSVPAMRLTARILGRLADEVRRDGHRFVLVAAGSCENEAPEFLAERANDPNFDPDKTTRFLDAVAREHGFEVIHLVPAMRRWYAEGRPRPAYGEGRRYGHWNSLGHGYVGRVLFDSLAPGLDGLAGAAPAAPAPDSAVQRGHSQPKVPPVSSP